MLKGSQERFWPTQRWFHLRVLVQEAATTQREALAGHNPLWLAFCCISLDISPVRVP